jgi:hypothetical protein
MSERRLLDVIFYSSIRFTKIVDSKEYFQPAESRGSLILGRGLISTDQIDQALGCIVTRSESSNFKLQASSSVLKLSRRIITNNMRSH